MTAGPNTTYRVVGTSSPDTIDRAAAVDDFSGGFARGLPASATELGTNGLHLPGSLDWLVLLRHAAAKGAALPLERPATLGRYRLLEFTVRGVVCVGR